MTARKTSEAVGRLGDRPLELLAGLTARLEARVCAERESRRVAALADEGWVQWVYREVFDREPDAMGWHYWVGQLQAGTTRQSVEAMLRSSAEAKAGPSGRRSLETFHGSRVTWTRSLPRARRILDLGGTSLDSRLGSLLSMGYPYDFDELVIIDLPSTDRHSLYQAGDHDDFMSPQGRIRYLYRSMADLDDLPDGSVDLVISGQTFEHVTPGEGEHILKEVTRLLAPEGHLALDTPNRAVTKIQCSQDGTEFINPDHKVEYTNQQMVKLFEAAGLSVARAHGIGYMPDTARTNTWLAAELAEHPGIYDDIESSYTLAYLARRAY